MFIDKCDRTLQVSTPRSRREKRESGRNDSGSNSDWHPSIFLNLAVLQDIVSRVTRSAKTVRETLAEGVLAELRKYLAQFEAKDCSAMTSMFSSWSEIRQSKLHSQVETRFVTAMLPIQVVPRTGSQN